MEVWATKSWAEDYIRDALQSTGGCHQPDSPFFGLKTNQIRVRSIPKKSSK